MKNYLMTLLMMMAGLGALAQTKTGAAEAVEKVEFTMYYGQKLPLKELQEAAPVVSVELPNESGQATLYSFDTEIEAQEAMEEKLGSRAVHSCTCYRDANYMGYSRIFTGKDYNALKAIGFNDVISSYKCTYGAYMIIYKDKNFTGNSLITGQQDANTHDNGFGDNISSIYFSF